MCLFFWTWPSRKRRARSNTQQQHPARHCHFLLCEESWKGKTNAESGGCRAYRAKTRSLAYSGASGAPSPCVVFPVLTPCTVWPFSSKQQLEQERFIIIGVPRFFLSRALCVCESSSRVRVFFFCKTRGSKPQKQNKGTFVELKALQQNRLQHTNSKGKVCRHRFASPAKRSSMAPVRRAAGENRLMWRAQASPPPRSLSLSLSHARAIVANPKKKTERSQAFTALALIWALCQERESAVDFITRARATSACAGRRTAGSSEGCPRRPRGRRSPGPCWSTARA